jgi:hypothetical protein
MSYQDLIGEEVYFGVYGYEEFHYIAAIEEQWDSVVISLERHRSKINIKISKENVDKFLAEEYVELVYEDKSYVLRSCFSMSEDDWKY